MTTIQTLLVVWTPVLAVLVTLLTSLFKVDGLSARWNNFIAIALAAVGSVVAVWQSGAFTGLNNLSSWTAVVVLVYGLAQAIYQFLLRGTKLDSALKAVRLTTKPKTVTTPVVPTGTVNNVTLTAPVAVVTAEPPAPGA